MNVPLRLLPFGRFSLPVTLAAASLFMCGAGAALTRAESQAAALDAFMTAFPY